MRPTHNQVYLLEREIVQLREELAKAWEEASCCDDISLDQPLAGIISDLQTDRERLHTELAKAREEAGRYGNEVFDAVAIRVKALEAELIQAREERSVGGVSANITPTAPNKCP